MENQNRVGGGKMESDRIPMFFTMNLTISTDDVQKYADEWSEWREKNQSRKRFISPANNME